MPTDLLNEALATTVEATRRAERDLFGALDAVIRERPIRADDWTPKDFQAHLTAWKGRQADRFVDLREGRETPPGLEGEEEDAINAELRATRIDWAWPAIVQEADEVTDRLIGELRRADPAAFRASDRLIPGTFGNGVFHALTHVRWLLEAGVPLDRARVAAFEEEALELSMDEAVPAKVRAVSIYNFACHHALTGSVDVARRLLPEAFRMDPKLVEFSRTDPDLEALYGEIDDLAS
jgi:hypothetical protein